MPHRSGSVFTIIIQPIYHGEVALLQELFWECEMAENPATHGLLSAAWLFLILEQADSPVATGILGTSNLNITVELTEYFHLLSQVPAICHAIDKNRL